MFIDFWGQDETTEIWFFVSCCLPSSPPPIPILVWLRKLKIFRIRPQFWFILSVCCAWFVNILLFVSSRWLLYHPRNILDCYRRTATIFGFNGEMCVCVLIIYTSIGIYFKFSFLNESYVPIFERVCTSLTLISTCWISFNARLQGVFRLLVEMVMRSARECRMATGEIGMGNQIKWRILKIRYLFFFWKFDAY